MKADALTGAARVLTHPLRFRVMEAIRQSPCSTKEAIAERLGVSVERVGFQVRVLRAAGVVGACEDGRLTGDMDLVRAALGGDDLGEGARE